MGLIEMLLALLLLLFAARGAEHSAPKLKIDLVKISVYVNGPTGDYYLGLEEARTGDIYFVSAKDGPIAALKWPEAFLLQTSTPSPLGKICLLAFIKAHYGLIDWSSFVTSAISELTPTELMTLPRAIWSELTLNQVAILLGRIPDDDFVGVIISRLEQKGKPVHEISTRSAFTGRVTGASEGSLIDYASLFFIIDGLALGGKCKGQFNAPFDLKVERKLFKEGSIVSRDQLLYICRRQ